MKSKSVKRAEAVTRNAKWAAMSPTEQLAFLDSVKLSAPKQRKKLAAILNK